MTAASKFVLGSHQVANVSRRALLSGIAFCAVATAPALAAPADKPWLDAARTPEQRAELVVAAMTDDEKLKLLQGDTELDANGTGVNACVGHISGIARLGLPRLCMGDGPAGVGNGMKGVTQFPAPVMGAATFDRDLMTAYGKALGAEHAGKGRNVVLAPTINIIRTPNWGRLAETLSEDPYLTAQLGTAITGGIQSLGLIATPKHFAANNQEWLRLGDGPAYEAVDAIVPERALREIYYPGFEAVVKQGKAGSIMCAYNRVNGQYACENPGTLGNLKRWGFDGFVVADWYFAHRSTAPSVKAGLDISMPGGVSPFGFAEFYGVKELKAARASGAITQADIDGMVKRIVTPMFRLGLVDHPIAAADANANVRDPGHLALSEKIAEEGTVLLRNERGVLPLKAKTIAVIGDDAGANVQTSERYGGFVKTEDVGTLKAPVDAIKAALGDKASVTYARGTLGIAPLPAMPASAFEGLTARYYASPDWKGEPLVTRKEQAIDYAEAGPKAGVQGLPSLWSARWTAGFVPPKTGTYRFSLNGGGEIALLIDGKRVAYVPKQSFRLATHGTVWLEAGKRVALQLDYSNAPTLSANELRLGWQAPDSTLIDEAVAAAKKAEVVVVFVADHVSEGADRTDLKLPGDQDALVEAVAAANPNTVVVLHTVGPVLMPWRDKVAGILAAWYPGEQAADSIAALLTGKANPSGKLPVTFPADEVNGPADQPARYPGIGTTARYDEGILVGYRWYDAKGIAPLYPFGHGLSYTRFAYSGLKLAKSGDGWSVRATVRNTGKVAGDEVAQLYVSMPAAANEPPRQLKGFARVSLQPGKSATVEFPLDRRALSYWDETAHDWQLAKGSYRVQIGSSSRDLPLGKDFDPAR
jgi:beta-glucosidase